VLRDVELELGAPLVTKLRGQGTRLAPLADKLLWADRRIAARLQPTLESLASELEGELEALLRPTRAALRINASHGFAVAALLEALNAHGFPVELKYRNSTEAVAALARTECDLAGFHVAEGELQSLSARPYREALDARRHVLILLAYRTQGLIVAPGNPKRIAGIEDLARPGVRFVNRQLGSGTRVLLDLLLKRHGIAPKAVRGFETAEFTHAAVAAYIASGMADSGFGLETAARRFKLDFLPVLRERYYFACDAAAIDRPELKEVLRLMRSSEFRSAVAAIPGYDGRSAGAIVSLEQAFGRAAASGGRRAAQAANRGRAARVR